MCHAGDWGVYEYSGQERISRRYSKDNAYTYKFALAVVVVCCTDLNAEGEKKGI